MSVRAASAVSGLPDCVLALLWDVDRASVDVARHARFLAARVLDYGDAEAVAWLRRTYGDRQIRQMLASGLRVSAKTRNFWRLLYEATGVNDVP